MNPKWEFPKIRGTLFWGPYHKDPTIWATILGTPIFGNYVGFFVGGAEGLESLKPKSSIVHPEASETSALGVFWVEVGLAGA